MSPSTVSFYGPLTVMGYSYFRIYRAATAYRSDETIVKKPPKIDVLPSLQLKSVVFEQT